MAKNILSLTLKDALDLMLKSKQYDGFELPEYFDFSEVLQFVRNVIGYKSYEECVSNPISRNLENVNIGMLLNKEAKYDLAPLFLPILSYIISLQRKCVAILFGKYRTLLKAS